MNKLDQLLEQRQNALYIIGQQQELLMSIEDDIEKERVKIEEDKNINFLAECPICERLSNTSDWHEKTRERYGFDIHTIYDIVTTGDGAGYICPKCNNHVVLEEEHVQQDQEN